MADFEDTSMISAAESESEVVREGATDVQDTSIDMISPSETAPAAHDETDTDAQPDFDSKRNEDQSMADADLSTLKLPMRVFAVTEIWLPHPVDEESYALGRFAVPLGIGENYVGVRAVAMFADLDEANSLALKHVKRLEQLTKQVPEDPNSDLNDPFCGKFTKLGDVRTYLNGTKQWSLEWEYRTTIIRVEESSVYGSVEDVPMPRPLCQANISSRV